MTREPTFLEQLADRHRREEAAADLRRTLDARASKEAYRIARIDKRSKEWQPDLLSGDSSIAGNHLLMHARFRDLFINNAQFKKAKQSLINLWIGDGIRAFSEPFDPWADFQVGDSLESFMDGLQLAFESDSWFDRWAEKEQCDIAGKQSWWDMQRMVGSETVEGGHVLLLRCQRRGPGRLIPLCYQVIEKDQLDTSKDRPAAQGVNKIAGGIEVDRHGRPLFYHIFEAHPFEAEYQTFAGSKSTPVPAERVIHSCLFHRPSHTTAVSWFHAAAQSCFDSDGYISAEMQTAKKTALLAVIALMEHPHAASLGIFDGDDDHDIYGNQEFALGNTATAAVMKKGDELKVIEPNGRPNSNAVDFLRHLDSYQAMGFGLSIERATGRYENSYTASRGAQLDDDLYIKPLQGWFGRQVILPVRRAVNAQFAMLRTYGSLSPAAFLRDEIRYQQFGVIGPGREQLDPEKETEAVLGKLRAGLTTLKIECARRGLHWVRVLMEIAREKAVAAHFGLTLDFSKGQGGERKGDTRSDDRNSQKQGKAG